MATYRKFDPKEVSGLLEQAKQGDMAARDELLFRFQRLVATLVQVLVTGRINPFSSYQRTFLRLFCSNKTSLEATAQMLKNELSGYTKEELFLTGQIAVLQAIQRCDSNLASTIVYQFKDIIYSMIRDGSKPPLNTDMPAPNNTLEDTEQEAFLQIFLNKLSPEERVLAMDMLRSPTDKYEPPESMIQAFIEVYGEPF